MGNEFLNVMEPYEAENILNSLQLKKTVEKVDIEKCLGRVLADDIYSPIDLPPFDRVAMDGYAVRAENTFGASEDDPEVLKLIDVVGAGDEPDKNVLEGTCVEVGTGAPVPQEADAVVMVEYTEKSGDQILFYQGVAPGENITKKGSDIEKDHLLLKRNTVLTPDKIGVLSAIGMKSIPVYSQTKVGIISTGNEIIPVGEDLPYAKVYDVNSQTITSAVLSCGCIPMDIQIVPDDFEALKNAINNLMDHVDIIITSGGTSAGAGDVLRAVIEDMGEVLVHGIAFKPGKPTLIGLIKGEHNKILVGLPGYPVAALVVFESLIAPFLRRRSGFKVVDDGSNSIQLKISRRFHPSRGRTHHLLVKVDDGLAVPIQKDSGAITALADADGYVEIPKSTEILEEGTLIQVKLFRRLMGLF
jgi:molybdopterin molybdotransferase